MTKWKPAPGDRIIGLGWGRNKPGTIVKIAKSAISAMVRFDGLEEDERVRTDAMRPETPEDVAKRAYVNACQDWRTCQPSVKHISLQAPSYFSAEPVGATIMNVLRNPDDMRAAAEELRLIAAWFEQKPSQDL